MPEPEYAYSNSEPTWANAYLWPVVEREVRALKATAVLDKGFDLGCGNGATSGMLAGMGLEMSGIDTSVSGIAHATAAFPNCRFEVASAYSDLASRFGQFPIVVSLEVVEHLFEPRRFARRLFDLVAPGGHAFVSTPYHGYWKNLVLALAGRFDRHLDPLWDGGHIKFFSAGSLTMLLEEAGFEVIRVIRVGRIAPLAKSMLAVAHRPNAEARKSAAVASAPDPFKSAGST